MATSCCRRREGVTAKFFKIILHPESDTLRIPKEFTRRHGQNLRNRVFLKVPEGSAMEVELIQSSTNGEALFKKGWLEFKERYSIGFGYLLIFSYNGNSQFDVLIFDPTATEISYPVEITQSAESDDDDSVVILENLEASTTPLAAKQDPKKRKRANNTIEFRSKSKGVARETCTAYQKALAYKCGTAKSNRTNCQQKPFFISAMHKSCVSAKFQLCVPVSVIKTIIPSNGTENLQLMMNGRKWCVKCWVEACYRSAKLSIGWRKFVEDNGLKVGDACIFQVHKSTEFVWDVMIFPS